MDGNQFIGFKFQLSSTFMISEVGFFDRVRQLPPPATIFAAILNLDSPSALPTGNPFDAGEVLGTTLIEVGPTATLALLAAALIAGAVFRKKT